MISRTIPRRRHGPVIRWLLLAAVAVACGNDGPSPAPALVAESPAGEVRRVVSLNPSLTEMLLALGAGDRLVGIDNASASAIPSLHSLPRVGGLFNPSLEAVLGLRPDLVVLVPSIEQRDFRSRLGSLGVPVVEFQNLRFAQVLENIAELGRLTGRQDAANRRIAAIRATRRAVASEVAGRPTPTCILVLQRDPLYVVGRGSFLDEMIQAVGARNAAAEFDEPYPMISAEWLAVAAPGAILDASIDAADSRLGQPGQQGPAKEDSFWQRWPSIPAVAEGRVIALDSRLLTLPGPRLDDALLLLLRAVHGPAAAESARRRIAPADLARS